MGSAPMIFAAVAAMAMGLAVLPFVLADEVGDGVVAGIVIAQGVLVRVELEDLQPIRHPISLVYRKNRKRSRTVQAYIDMMTNMYSCCCTQFAHREDVLPRKPELEIVA